MSSGVKTTRTIDASPLHRAEGTSPDPAETSPATTGDRSAIRIGVLTFHRCINYGSYWQARCLVEGLRSQGHDAVLLDHASAAVDRAEWRCAFQPLLPKRSSRADIAAYGRKTRLFRSAIAALPLSRPFPLERPETMEAFDLVIIGSDEVWNLTHPWYGGWPIFYGSGIRAERIASYAASFGNYDAGAGLTRDLADRLGNLTAISVRDFNSLKLVRGALGETPPVVLDPCMQFPPTIANDPAPVQGGDEVPYVAVYGHGFADWFWQRAQRWARKRGYRLLSIGYRNDWVDEQRIDASPYEFARLIGRAVAVVTNFFHGCVFALLYSKPFVCAGTPYRMNKIRDLTTAVGAQQYLTDEGVAEWRFDSLLDDPLPNSINVTIARLRAGSHAYLQTVLA